MKESIKKENYKPTHSILYEVDFIQLANFLFKAYSIKDSSKLPEILSKLIEDGMDEEKKNKILEYLPKNNWDRYFSNLVELESGQLKKKLEKLYEIRCKVAHNKSMNFEDFELAKNLCEELDEALNKAYTNIDNIEIPEEDKESIGLRTMGVVNEPTNYFVNNYLNLSDNVSNILKNNSEKYSFLENIENPISAIVDSSISGQIKLSDELQNDLFTINDYKNDLLSGNIYIDPFKTEINDKIFLSTQNDIVSALNFNNLNLNPLSINPSISSSKININGTITLDKKNNKNEDDNDSSETD